MERKVSSPERDTLIQENSATSNRDSSVNSSQCLTDEVDSEVCSAVAGMEESSELRAREQEPEVGLSVLNPAPLFRIDVLVGDTEIQALIDTGASCSLIREDALQDGYRGRQASSQLTVLGGNSVGPVGEVDLRILIGSMIFVETFRVLPADSMSNSMVLGDSFLTKYGVSVDMNLGRLSGRTTEGGRWDYYKESSSTVYLGLEVRISDDVVIPPGETKFVGVDIPDDMVSNRVSDMFLDAAESKLSSRLQVHAGVLDFVGMHSGVLLSAFKSNKGDTFIKSGELIGSASTIVDLYLDVSLVNTDKAGSFVDNIELDHLDDKERNVARDMLVKRAAAFSTGDEDIGCAGLTKHRIELYDTTPIRQKPRRFPAPVTEEIERQCDELRELDIIRYSRSPWSSPVVPIRKKDGTLRLCIDYRKLNKVTKSDRFPMPSMTDLVFSLHGARYFTTLDLVKGYYQVPLDPSTADCTAFSTSSNHYQFKRLSFGLKNAPAAFQREMQEVLREFESSQVIVYIDDILILGRTYEEHLDLVDRVLQTLEHYGMKIKPEKCSWIKTEVKFLGHIVGRNGVRKSPEYVESVVDFPRPENVKQLRSFLGLVNFQRKFIPNCSVLSKPLTQWMGKPDRTRLQWNNDMDKAFSDLKEEMKADIELVYPDYALTATPMELSCDASLYGAGACLAQRQGDQMRVIGYASTTFNKAQQNYSTIEKELEAIRWSVQVFRSFLVGVKFILFTDHRPLVYMSNMAKTNSRVMRTLNEIGEYNFEVKYRPGKENILADTMSRLHAPLAVDAFPAQTPTLKEGLKVIKLIQGGPDSLVESLWECLSHYRENEDPSVELPEDSCHLRRILAEELLDNISTYFEGRKSSVRPGVKLSRYPGTLPPVQFIEAFSKLFDLEVWVHHEMDKPIRHCPYTSNEQDGTMLKRIHVQCLGGVHYNPIVENKLYQPEPPKRASDREEGIVGAVLEELEGADLGASLEVDLHSAYEPCNCGRSLLHAAQTSVQIGRRHYCSLLDTGAQISLIREDAVLDLMREGLLPGEYVQTSTLLRCIGKSTVPTKGMITTEVSFGGLVLGGPVTFGVVEAAKMPICVLLGANFIRRFNVEVNYKSRIFSLDSEFGRRTLSFLPVSGVLGSVSYCLTHDDIVEPQRTEPEPRFPLSLSKTQIVGMQRADPQLRRVADMLLKKNRSRWKGKVGPFSKCRNSMVVHDGIVYHRIGEEKTVVSSRAFLIEVVTDAHISMSHPGKTKLSHMLKTTLWHPKLDQIISDICLSCVQCQKSKVHSGIPHPPVTQIKMTRPFQMVAVDILTLPRTTRGFNACLMTVDHLSKWANIVPIRDKKADTVARSLEERVFPNLPRRPETVLSDNGPEFTAVNFNKILEKKGIRHLYTTPYKPSSNGAIERLNRTILENLRTAASSNTNWDMLLPKIVEDYNNSYHSSINTSPSDFLLTLPHDIKSGPGVSNAARTTWREGHPSFVPFKIGSKVLRITHREGNLSTNKLTPRFSGPYEVVRVNENGVTYVLTSERGTQKVHHSQLRRFYEPPRYLLESDAYTRMAGVELESPAEDLDDPHCPEGNEEYDTEDSSSESDLDSGSHAGTPSAGVEPYPGASPRGNESPITTLLGPSLRITPDRTRSEGLWLGNPGPGSLDSLGAVPGGNGSSDYNSVREYLHEHLDTRQSLDRSYCSIMSNIERLQKEIKLDQILLDWQKEMEEFDRKYPDWNLDKSDEVAEQSLAGGPALNTRSRGPAPEYPTVQARVLEYRAPRSRGMAE